MVGVITNTDIAAQISHCQGASCITAAALVMKRDVVLCEAKDLLHDVWTRMKARGLKVGVATNDSVGGLHASLARVGLRKAFDFLVAADSGHGGKPGPGMALAFAAASGLDPRHLAAVGDATHDLEMAQHAGYALKVAVLSGTGSRSELSPHADIVIGSISELPELLG